MSNNYIIKLCESNGTGINDNNNNNNYNNKLRSYLSSKNSRYLYFICFRSTPKYPVYYILVSN